LRKLPKEKDLCREEIITSRSLDEGTAYVHETPPPPDTPTQLFYDVPE